MIKNLWEILWEKYSPLIRQRMSHWSRLQNTVRYSVKIIIDFIFVGGKWVHLDQILTYSIDGVVWYIDTLLEQKYTCTITVASLL
jgi:hypothetical protein